MTVRYLLMVVALAMVVMSAGVPSGMTARSSDPPAMPPAPLTGSDIAFTENRGQWGDEVLFRCDRGDGWSWFTRSGVVHQIVYDGECSSARIEFAGGSGYGPGGIGDLGYDSNFFHGDVAVTGARSYSSILYEDVWPGIDIRYGSKGGGLKYDIIVGPWADPDSILFKVSGHRSLRVDGGALAIELNDGVSILDAVPVSFDERGEAVRSEFRIASRDIYGFDVDKRAGSSIVIDPLVYSSYLGGSSEDDGEVLIDTDGFLYFTGTTNSPDIPIVGGVQASLDKWYDVFVTKMVPNGSSIVFSTYIGGANLETLMGSALDGNGTVFLTGTTNSIDYPTTSGAYQESNKNTMYNDIFITRLNASGDRLLYSTYISGDWYETSTDILIVDGCAAICGIMESHDFPTEQGPVGSGVHGTVFFLMMNSSGSGILDSCLWDTGGSERAEAMDMDANGDIVIGGYTSDPAFPVTAGAYRSDPKYLIGPVMFILKYRPSSGNTVFSSLLGNRSSDYLTDVCFDPNGDILFCGRTSGWGNYFFPTTNGSFDRTLNGTVDGVVGKLSGDGTRLLFSTLLGGDSDDSAASIVSDDEGCPYVTGSTGSRSGLTSTAGCLDPSFNGVEDAFAARLSRDGSRLQYFTYIGGTDEDRGGRIVLTPERYLIVSGYTLSVDLPVSNGSYQSSNKGATDAFVTILELTSPPGPPRNLTAASGDSVIDLEWAGPSSDGGSNISKYLVYRGEGIDGWTLISEVVDGLSYHDRDLSIGGTYYYAVSCMNSIGESGLSDVAMNVSITLPSPPLNVTAFTYTDFIAVEWSAPSFTGGCEILSFEISRGQDGGNATHLASLEPSKRSYLDRDVEDGEVYAYSITTVNRLGPSLPSNVSARMSGPPTPPRNLTYTHSDRMIVLRWEGPEDPMELPLQTFNVYRWVDDGGPVLLEALSPASDTYEDRAVENGRTYHYSMTAVNAKGESGHSNVIHAVPRTVPSPPSEAKGAWSGSDAVLTWSRPTDDGGAPILGYYVHFAIRGGEYAVIGSVPPAEVLRFTHSIPLSNETRYYYVTSFNSEGGSLPGNKVTLEPLSPPGAPMYVMARSGDGASTIEWIAPEADGGSPILGYMIYRSNVSAEEMARVATVGNITLRFDDGPLTNGVTYHYSVSAFNVAGEGERSETVIVVPEMALGPVQGMDASSHRGRIELSWSPPANDGSISVDGYYIYRSHPGNGGPLEMYDQCTSAGYTDDLVTKGAVYSYAVTPFTDRAEGPLGDIVNVTCRDIPDPPSSVQVDIVDGLPVVRWTAPINVGGTPVTHYVVRRHSASPTPDLEENVSSLEFRDTNVAAGSSYTYRVIAVNAEGESLPVETNVQVPTEDRPVKEREGLDWRMFAIPALILIIAVLSVIVWRSKRQDVWEE